MLAIIIIGILLVVICISLVIYNKRTTPLEVGSLEWCKQKASDINLSQDSPYDIIGISIPKCDKYTEEMEKVILDKHRTYWRGTLFYGTEQNQCLNKLQPIINEFRTLKEGTFSYYITECNKYQDKAAISLLGVNPDYKGKVVFG